MGEPARSMSAASTSSRLKRGLASLLTPTRRAVTPEIIPPASPGGGAPRRQLLDIPVQQIRENPCQPRRVFREDALKGLAESIRRSGVLQPVVVRRTGTGFELVAGERRLRAAREAGLETIPAVVREADDDRMLELALIENVQRDDLNPMELSRAFAMLVKRFGLTHDEIAARMGLSRPAVVNTLRLLELPEILQEMVASEKFTAGHARAILSVDSEAGRLALARDIMSRNLTVRDAEVRAAAMGRGAVKARRGQAPAARPAHLKALEARLAQRLGTRVRIIESKRKSKIVIEFYSNEDFERILEVIGAAA
ncbi:MAG: ParB/RepB/Spo0J family partition protein [Planctomycetota bacterium]|jgi:ParB family chromosome partitioning protein